jgi:hypothetical protein
MPTQMFLALFAVNVFLRDLDLQFTLRKADSNMKYRHLFKCVRHVT